MITPFVEGCGYPEAPERGVALRRNLDSRRRQRRDGELDERRIR